ncbi:CPBP family intramembrane glutamic endopeptidase [Mesobacillus foraminis]|uniref:CAAX prenyl protease 2/Lysostaphin resistance protein A-like domain-containing protein n=1 Tax=Mesobacillus foraminis TaxID=279826 RepID=A0A4R2BE38_9BACI|nr:CPBP family intramembrane glutamic endopeptidase [Mesobacillus foraminis]TCN25016.1 hypothetical protein EV146_106218 [Mesobacillus foraminis]
MVIIGRKLIRNAASLCLFILLVITIQIKSYPLAGLWILGSVLLWIFFDKSIKAFVMTNLCFGIGFFFYLYAATYWTVHIETKELSVFFNRFSLVMVLIPMALLSRFSGSPFLKYWKKPVWDEMISFPFIWSGFHQTKVKTFLIIALTVNVLIFTPFVIGKGWPFIKEIWLLTMIFSLTNAIFEELIWRGALLSSFSEQLGEKWAVVVTSLGFGLQHYSLGFPWAVCIAFSIGGLFYGGITIKSKSIVPSIIWHITLNILMFLSGLIIK